jgi:hypothetical protein
MAKIYISYRRNDAEFAIELSKRLTDLHHTIVIDVDLLKAGQDWRETLTKGLREAEIFVALLTEESQHSQWVLSEIGMALGYAQNNKQILALPGLQWVIYSARMVTVVGSFSPCATLMSSRSCWLWNDLGLLMK